MMATTMTANVAMVIIPGQRKVVAALREGRPVDPVHGQRGKQRSVHNTYFTLPVVFTMISNHYGFVFGARHNWLVLVVLMLAGALMRVSFVLRHKALVEQRPVPWRYAIAGTLIVVATVAVLLPAPPAATAQAAAPTFARGRGDRRAALQRLPQRGPGQQERSPRFRGRDPRPCAAGLPAGGRAEADADEQRHPDDRRRARRPRPLVRGRRAGPLAVPGRGAHTSSPAPAARPRQPTGVHHVPAHQRHRPRLRSRDHARKDPLPPVDRRQLGGPVLAPEGFHPGLHDRARLHGQDRARVHQAQRQADRPVGRPGRPPRAPGPRTSRRRRAPPSSTR